MVMRRVLAALTRAFHGHSTKTYEQRGAIRHKGRGRTATILIQGRQEPVRIHNISRTGMMIEMTASPYIGERIKVVFDDGRQVGAMVCWYEETRAGIKFDAPMNIE